MSEERTKHGIYALVSFFMMFVLAVFIIFGPSLCSLSEFGKTYGWFGVLASVFFIVMGAFVITGKSLKLKEYGGGDK